MLDQYGPPRVNIGIIYVIGAHLCTSCIFVIGAHACTICLFVIGAHGKYPSIQVSIEVCMYNSTAFLFVIGAHACMYRMSVCKFLCR